jgi:hypothetical protein
MPPLVGRQEASWRALLELAPALRESWLLIGGQMVLLHEVERQARDLRPTDDIDVVVNLRVDPGGLARIHATLTEHRFVQALPSTEGVAHRYEREGAVIDVLAPDHIGKRAQLRLGSGRTIEAPGTSQAFTRSAHVLVELVDGATAIIRRPTLVGALIGKAAAVLEITSQSPAARAKHLRDVDALARLLGVDDRDNAGLSTKERANIDRLRHSFELSALATESLRVLVESG